MSEVRLFVSSTFRDMHAERDHLVTTVFPELRERLSRLGLDFYDVDLRWGVPETGVDGERANSWEYCKRWITRVEPFFICLLGERYGHEPDPAEITDADDRAAYAGMSVTEMEVRHAVLSGRLHRRSYFYMRSTPVPPDTPEPLYAEYVTEGPRDRLDALQAEIRESGRPVRDYECRWTGSGFAELEAFGRAVLEDLWSGVLRDPRYVPREAWQAVRGLDPGHDPLYVDESQPIPAGVWTLLIQHAKPPPPDPLTVEAEGMAAFMAPRLRWFTGRERELRELTRFVVADLAAGDSSLRVVSGLPGQGKSALLAKLADKLAGTRHLVVPHFVGATERSANVRDLLERLVGELDRARIPKAGAGKPGPDIQSLSKHLATRLGDYDAKRRVVLLVDAVDQLVSGHDLTWLPRRLGPGVRVVLSTVEGPPPALHSVRARLASALAERHPRPGRISLSGLDEQDVRKITVDYLEEYCKELEPPQITQISEMPQARNPLYLRVMLDELRTLGGNDMQEIVRTVVADLPVNRPTTLDLFDWRLERLEVFGKDLVRRWCTYLALGRSGMSSKELSDLVAADLGTPAAAQALLIERGIRAYLQRRGGQLDFFHGQLREAVQRRYPATAQALRDAHWAISRQFRNRADPFGREEWNGHDERALGELPYHLIESGRREELLGTLTDFRFLEHKVSEVAATERRDSRGHTPVSYAGVFALNDDFDLAVESLGGHQDTAVPPLIVTPVDQGDGLSILRCPYCGTAHQFQEDWRDRRIACPQCQGDLRVTPFTFRSINRRSS
jgi:hypothetical protein